MSVSYNKLWKLLIDRKMMKKDLREMAGIGSATPAKMGRDETISGEVVVKIYTALHCGVEDIIEIVEKTNDGTTVSSYILPHLLHCLEVA